MREPELFLLFVRPLNRAGIRYERGQTGDFSRWMVRKRGETVDQDAGAVATGRESPVWPLLAGQGADMGAFADKLALDHTAPAVLEMKSDRAGFVSRCDAQIIGEVIRDLGGGRITKESVINYDVGIDRIAKPGDRVEVSGVLCRIHASEEGQARTAAVRLKAAFAVSSKRPSRVPLIAEVIREPQIPAGESGRTHGTKAAWPGFSRRP